MTFNPNNGNQFKINTPFDFSYTLSESEISSTVNLCPGGFFYIGIMVNGNQVNLGNGTNNHSAYGQMNVYYQQGEPLNFSNRSFDTLGTYTFSLYFNQGPYFGYYQNTVYTTTITFKTQVIPISNICFPAGTPIVTNQGSIPIEKIDPKIHTIRNKKIVGITQTISKDTHLVCFDKDSLGNNVPSQKTIISKNHKVFYKGHMMDAKFFVGRFENVRKVEYSGELLYNVLMEDYDKMIVNNMICETLHPENFLSKLYKYMQNLNPEDEEKIIKKYNEYVVKNNVFHSKKLTK